MQRLAKFIALIGLLSNAGCSTPTSSLAYVGATSKTTPAYVRSIVGYVRCELARTVYDNRQAAPWLVNWGAIIDLKLSIDRKASVSPNAVFTDFFSGRSETFSNGTRVDGGRSAVIGIGLSGEAGSKRSLKIAWFEDFAELMEEREKIPRRSTSDCSKLGEYPVTGDIQVGDALASAVFAASAGGLATRDDSPTGPLKVLEHQLTFQTNLSASATPSIFLFTVSLNPSGPFLAGSRTQVNDLLITMGPVEGMPIRPLAGEQVQRSVRVRPPSRLVLDSNLTSNIGIASQR